ncbi:MAG: hypothetical protein WC091_07375 [Sulfuricellaceae bacterium]
MTALLLLTTVLTASLSIADSSTSKALLEKAYDVRQLVRSGVNYPNYSKLITEVNLALGRFDREHKVKSDADRISLSLSDTLIRDAATAYIEAGIEWERKVNGEIFANENSIQRQWEFAEGRLEKLEQLGGKKGRAKK